jgi:hypothetical protein
VHAVRRACRRVALWGEWWWALGVRVGFWPARTMTMSMLLCLGRLEEILTMSRFRFVMFGLIVVMLMMMGVAASSASAVEFKLEEALCTGGTFVALCWEKEKEGTDLKELVGEEEFSAKLTAAGSTLTGTLGGEKVKVVCTEGGSTGGKIVQPKPLEEDVKLTGVTFLFKGCSLTEGPTKKCKVPAEIELLKSKATPENLEAKLSENWLHFVPEETTGIFAEIKFENNGTEKCPVTIAGEEPVKGEQWCEWLEILVDLESHEFHCEPSESKLTFGENEATFEALFTVTLNNGKFWDIEEEV